MRQTKKERLLLQKQSPESDAVLASKLEAEENISYKTKKRYWVCLAYPESVPDDWIQILEDTGLKIAISPLHDKDVYTKEDERKNPEHKAGTLKKPHWHVILIYNGPTSFNVVKKITDSINGPIPIPIEAVKGKYEYLTHKNNPEKAQYDSKEIRHLNGFTIVGFLNGSEISKLRRQIRDIIREKNIVEYSKLLDYFDSIDDSELTQVAETNTMFFNTYITSRRHVQKEKLTSLMTAADVATLGEEALGDNDNDTIKEE